MNSRTKLTSCYIGRDFGPGLVPTRALEFLTAVLSHDGLDLRQFKTLVSQRRGDLLAAFRVQRSGTLLTNRRIVLVHMVHLLNRTQLSLVAFVSLSGHLESETTSSWAWQLRVHRMMAVWMS
jgi:hypothetical protein